MKLKQGVRDLNQRKNLLNRCLKKLKRRFSMQMMYIEMMHIFRGERYASFYFKEIWVICKISDLT